MPDNKPNKQDNIYDFGDKESSDMQGSSPRLNVTTLGDIAVVELADRKILDEVNISEIGEQMNSLVADSDNPKLLVDFANVAHMSSSALGMLITLHKRIRQKEGELRLCNIQPSIYEVFVITRLNEIFEISQSRQEALESLR
jgi:anti-sigma B factor antagonist